MCGRSNSLSAASIAIIQAINDNRRARRAEADEARAQAVELGGQESSPVLFAASDAATTASLALASAIDDILLAELSADTSAGRRYAVARQTYDAAEAAYAEALSAAQQAAFAEFFGRFDGLVEGVEQPLAVGDTVYVTTNGDDGPFWHAYRAGDAVTVEVAEPDSDGHIQVTDGETTQFLRAEDFSRTAPVTTQ